MQWILFSVIGLAIFLGLAWRLRRALPTAYRDAVLDDALPAHLAALATQADGRGRVRLRLPHSLLRSFERSVGFLNTVSSSELLPAAVWLCDNGRYLQEEIASLRLTLQGLSALPQSSERSIPRVSIFARELLGHSTADFTLAHFRTAADAWQRVLPFSVEESNALPAAFKFTLLVLLTEMAQECAQEQKCRLAAVRTERLIRHDREKQALRLFQRYKHESAYLEQLLCKVRTQPGSKQPFWLESYFSEHAPASDTMAKAEHDHQAECCQWVSNAVTSLRAIGRLPWQRVLEDLSPLHAALCSDEIYPQMDRESRAYYRACVARLARRSGRSEQNVYETALSLAQNIKTNDVRAHVGYYLLDEGVETLMRRLQLNRLTQRLYRFTLHHAFGLARFGSWLAFAFLLIWARLMHLPFFVWLPLGAVFLYSAQQFVIARLQKHITPRLVPRMRVERLNEQTQTLVVCPTMLLNAKHALAMVKHLSVLHEANPDPHLHFLLLGDFQDSLTGTLSGDEDIVTTADTAIRALCESSGHPFFYLQRERVFADHIHMSRERKRGGVETLLCLVDGRPIEDRFVHATFAPETLKGKYRYVITLDSDTILPPGSALRMIGAMLHPLQRREKVSGRMRGISVLQPRMETAAHNVSSPLCRLLGGCGGTDPYNTLVANWSNDLYRQGTYMGKGIIDPAPFLDATQNAVLPGCVLSHDLLEGELSGCALASDITLYDGHPKTLKGFLFRLHRWTRGDWQLLPYVLPLFPKLFRAPRGVLNVVARHKLWQNLLRSLVSPLRVLLMAYAVAFGRPWLLAALVFLPELPYLPSFSLHAIESMFCRLAVLPCEACMQADAIVRTLYRLLVSHEHLLQWTTAAQVSRPTDKPPMLFFYMSMISGGVIAALAFLPNAVLYGGVALGIWWAFLPFLLPFLEQPYQRQQRPTGYMREVLTRLAQSTLTFFETAITDSDHALPPDNVQIEPNKGISHRTSPTNIGMYLCSLIAAEKLRLLDPNDMAQRMAETLATVERLPKWRGHLFNWYDTQTLAPLKPPFVSSVDSGNLAVCLLTCAQGLRALLTELDARYHDLSARMDLLAQQMDLAALFDAEAELFYVGVHPQEGAPTAAHYDLLASESRLLSFVAVMLRKVPVRHWYRLGRPLTQTRAGQTLISYSGTMFEYLLPLVFQPTVRDTLLEIICRNAVKVQQRHRLGGIFGVSESGYYAFDPNLYYQYKAFGLPKLALSPNRQSDVIAPYASLISMPIDLKRAFQNVLRMQSLGLEGPLGLFEAADFSPERTEKRTMRIVRSHMAHHQGMILCAICNALEQDYLAHLFSDLPRAQAYRLLPEERFSRGRGLIRHPLRRRAREELIPTPNFQRNAESLCFPVDAHVLHGAGTTLLVDAQGGGYLSRNGVMLTRFHESCAQPSGMRLFLRDSQSGAYWNVTDPAFTRSVSFETAQAVFTQIRFEVESTLRIFVNPLDGTALHCLTLQNSSAMERMMEVCSYLEPALAPQRDDAAHPAFSNLFLRTERLQKHGVAAIRRPRRAEDGECRLWHQLSTDASLTFIRIQTDRTAFLGRGRSVYAPRALELPISALADTLGDVIEPCLSLRAQFVLPPKGRLQFVFTTLMPSETEKPNAFYERYVQIDSALKCYESAFTQALVSARYVGLTSAMQEAVSRIAGALCYTGQPAQFRHAAKNTLPLSGLWSLGISGELPLWLIECKETADLSLVQLALKAHALYRMNGFWLDLVLVVAQPTGYGHPFFEQLADLMRTCHSHALQGSEGGIHLFDNLTDEQLGLLRASARLILRTDGGTLADQLRAMKQSMRVRPLYACRPSTQWKAALPEGDALFGGNEYGGFTRAEGNYQITLPPGRQTPAPWCNPLCSEHFGTLASESGLVFTYAQNSHNGRLTRWSNDSVTARGDENFFLRDDAHRLLWSITRQPLGHGMPVRITHAPGLTTYECSGYGIGCRMQCFTDPESGIGARVIRLKNEDQADRTLTLMHTCVFSPGTHPNGWQLTALTRGEGMLYMTNPCLQGTACLCGIDPLPTLAATMSAGAFQGLWSVAPAALASMETLPGDAGNAGVLCYTLQLKPGESRTVTTAIAFAESTAQLDEQVARFRKDGAGLHLHGVLQNWEKRLGVFSFDLPDPVMAVLLGRWLPYQVQASRLFMRAGFYQAGGAYGFRDQLQDMLSMLHTHPDEVRAHLLRCAAHQFREGDVQHWWHPPYEGVRTRISDDKLFLPYVTALYVQATGDTALLNEVIPYLDGEPLEEGEHERFFAATVSEVAETLRMHCLRAIDHVRFGAHGLPLMGGGDWNDGMNRVGGESGESVWLGMFLCEVLRLFAPLCEPQTTQALWKRRQDLLSALEHSAWDGAWYLRGWYSDGSKLGSASCAECRIDLLSQSWSVLCGASSQRGAQAMDSAWRLLYERDAGLIKLFSPPFNGLESPGYIAGYLPGVRENGGQYTHAACWALAALHMIGQNDRAWELANALLPTTHAQTRRLALRYRVEPYVMAADIYANPQQRGRGGWTWYTGSAGWYQYVMLEKLFGFQKTGAILRFRPVVPASWEGLRITYRYGTATYHLRAARDCPFPMADGEQLRDGRLILKDDGRIHEALFPLR